MTPAPFPTFSLMMLLFWSGPVLPLLCTLGFRRVSRPHFVRNLWLLSVLTCVQAAAFLPYILAVLNPPTPAAADFANVYYGFSLFLAAVIGAVLLGSSAIYALIECCYLAGLHGSRPGAEPRAAIGLRGD